MAEIHPKRIRGNWKEGFALDFHTLRSEYIGDDEYGHPQFETTRSEIGELRAVLLFDDLYRSGATLNAVTRVLLEQGEARNVYALTLTMTRRMR